MSMGLQLLDDFSGEPLDRDHEALTLRVGLQGWNLYLTDDSKDALHKALEPFTKTAEPIEARPERSGSRTRATGRGRGRAEKNTYGFDTKDVRAWAINSNVQNIKSDGTKSPVGDRGVLAQNVYDEYKEAQG